LNFELGFPQITPARKVEAIARRDAVLIEWGEIMMTLTVATADAGRSSKQCYGWIVGNPSLTKNGATSG